MKDMKRALSVFLFASALLLHGGQLALVGKNTGQVTPLGYKCNEDIHFSVTVQGAGKADSLRIRWVCRTDDGGKSEGIVPASEGAEITARLQQPGFVYIHAVLTGKNGDPVKNSKGRNIEFRGSAGAEVDKIAPFPEPADFDKFWNAKKAELKKVPFSPELKVLRKVPGGTVYIVKLASLPTRYSSIASGYLTVPDGAKPESLKIEVRFNGYGYFRHGAAPLRRDRISFLCNAHGFPVDCDDEFFREYGKKIRFKGKGYGFHPEENALPETSYFFGMVMRNLRVIDYLCSLPEWNGKDLIVAGESQGGFQALQMAGLEPRVTECIAGIPWCGDVGGRVGKRVLSDFAPVPAPGLNYFSAAHHAKRIKCKTVITRAGLGDNICPSSQVAAIFNALPDGSEIHWYQGSTHNFIPENPGIFKVVKGKNHGI